MKEKAIQLTANAEVLGEEEIDAAGSAYNTGVSFKYNGRSAFACNILTSASTL